MKRYAPLVSVHWLLPALVLAEGALLAPRAAAQERANQPPAATAPADKAAPATRTVGVLLFPGFELLDAYGPMELWGNLGPQVRVVTIGKQRGPIASAQGPQSIAQFSYRAAPALDLLLVPGGPGARALLNDQPTLEFVRTRAAKAELVMSVCNGASILAAAGLLDGRRATTNKASWKVITARRPAVHWVASARWVEDGKLVTSSGVSAGMDMTLHAIARLFGQATADDLANGTEYEWHRDPSWDPFARAHGLVERSGEQTAR